MTSRNVIGHVTKFHCWQNSWQAYCLRTIYHAKMDSVRVMLDLESAASEVEVLEVLKQLTVKSLKLSGNKAKLIGRLLSYWTRSLLTTVTENTQQRLLVAAPWRDQRDAVRCHHFDRSARGTKIFLVCAISSSEHFTNTS